MKFKKLKHVVFMFFTMLMIQGIPVNAMNDNTDIEPSETVSEKNELNENSEDTSTNNTENENISDALTQEASEDLYEATTSQYDEIIKDDDTFDAEIFKEDVIVDGVSKSEETCHLTIEARGFEYLQEDFDKEIYAVIMDVNKYNRYGVILNKENEYKKDMDVPAGHYILDTVGLTHGKAIDYFSFNKEVVCAPGTEEELWFKLYSYKVELKKAEQQKIEQMKDIIEETEQKENNADYIEPVTGPGTEYTKVEETKKGDILSAIISLLAIAVTVLLGKKYVEKKQKEKEEKSVF